MTAHKIFEPIPATENLLYAQRSNLKFLAIIGKRRANARPAWISALHT
jgi:hypothetical protein